MRIIILKETNKPLSNRTFKPGDNLTVTRQYGNELVKKKLAAEIPHLVGNVWHFQGHPSNKMLGLRKPKPVTLEEYNEYKREQAPKKGDK